jgi:hypothetical protein
MNATDTELAPFDEADAAILRELREVAGRLDPCPGDLTERIKFALTVRALEAEVAELTAQPGLVSRSAAGEDLTEASTVTFSTDNLSIMVTIAPSGAGRARLDGWLTCGRAEVECRLDAGGALTVSADDDGRFVLPDVPRGGAQLIVRTSSGRPVITPQFTV